MGCRRKVSARLVHTSVTRPCEVHSLAALQRSRATAQFSKSHCGGHLCCSCPESYITTPRICHSHDRRRAVTNGIRGKGGKARADTGADLHDGLCPSSLTLCGSGNLVIQVIGSIVVV